MTVKPEWLSEDMAERLIANPEAATSALEWLHNLAIHRNNPVYVEAQRFFVDKQRGQIAKGAAKYPEPLNPESWSLSQLVEHAMEEVVDQVHYLTALRTKADRMAELLAAAGRMEQTLADIAEMVRDSQPGWAVVLSQIVEMTREWAK